MQNRQTTTQRRPLIHYGVLAILVLALFVIGYRAGSILTNRTAPASSADNSATPAPGGAAQVQPPQPVQDFTLTSKTGAPLSFSDLRGEPVLLFFGYTHCPDECPKTMADYTQVKQLLGAAGDKVHFVFVSVDSKRDTPDVLTQFLNQFDPAFIGLTGSSEGLKKLGAQFGLVFDQVVLGNDGSSRPASPQDENYFVTHTSPSFLIDKDGYLTRVIFYGTKPEVIADNLRQFLPQSS